MMRCFIALPVPEPLIAQLETLQQMLPLGTRVPPENFHVTLAFLGDLGAMQLDDLHDRLLALKAAPVEVCLGPPSVFGGERPRLTYAAVQVSAPLIALHCAVQGAVRRAGLSVEARRYLPHVTLSRNRPVGVDLARLETALVQMAGFSAGPEVVREVCLMQSHLGKRGAAYDVVESYPLSG